MRDFLTIAAVCIIVVTFGTIDVNVSIQNVIEVPAEVAEPECTTDTECGEMKEPAQTPTTERTAQYTNV